MNYKHEHHLSKPVVAGLCKNCGQTFCRDGDLLTFSTSYATESYKTEIKTIDDVRNYREWLLFAGDYCDNCLPSMPAEVRQDIEYENERRQADKQNYNQTKDIYMVPNHEPKIVKQENPSRIKEYFIKKGKYLND